MAELGQTATYATGLPNHELRLQLNESLPHVLMMVRVVCLSDHRSPTTVSYVDVTTAPTQSLHIVCEACSISIQHNNFPLSAWAPGLQPQPQKVYDVVLTIGAAGPCHHGHFEWQALRGNELLELEFLCLPIKSEH